jgi:hypothetical protein
MVAFKINSHVTLGLAVAIAGFVLTEGTPAQALNPGCTCPAGTTPFGANSCSVLGAGLIPATCTAPAGGPPVVATAALNQSAGHLAASQQQLSFEGVREILEARRDQLQGTLGASRRTTMISGYSESALEAATDALGYTGQSKRSNPLASAVYNKAPPAPMSSGPSFAAWTQGLADREHDDATSPDDMSHVTHTYAAQAGVDGTWQNLATSGDAMVVGLVGSWTSSHVSYDGTPTSTKLEGPGVGLYGTYVNGGFSVDLTTKFDFLQLTQDFAGLAPANALTLTNGGVSGNIQYKTEFSGGNFLEPTGGFSYTRTMFGPGGIAVGLGDASTVRLQAGTRFGTTWTFNGISVEPSLKALAFSNVIAEGSAAAAAAATGIVPTDQGKIRGEVDPDVNWDFGNGSTATLAGAVRFGQGLIGGSASLNLRKQW